MDIGEKLMSRGVAQLAQLVVCQLVALVMCLEGFHFRVEVFTRLFVLVLSHLLESNTIAARKIKGIKRKEMPSTYTNRHPH